MLDLQELGNSIEAIDSYTGTRYNSSMIRSFRHRGLRRLYERGDPSRIGADLLDRITLALADLDAASKPSDRATLICRATDCIPSGVTGEDRGASQFRATGGSPSGSKMAMCTTSI